MTSNPPDLPHVNAKTLADALEKNEDAVDAVREVADELVVVHAVLTQEIAGVGDEGDAAHAVERTASLQKKLTETAEKMLEVNQALAEQQASLKHLKKAKAK